MRQVSTIPILGEELRSAHRLHGEGIARCRCSLHSKERTLGSRAMSLIPEMFLWDSVPPKRTEPFGCAKTCTLGERWEEFYLERNVLISESVARDKLPATKRQPLVLGRGRGRKSLLFGGVDQRLQGID